MRGPARRRPRAARASLGFASLRAARDASLADVRRELPRRAPRRIARRLRGGAGLRTAARWRSGCDARAARARTSAARSCTAEGDVAGALGRLARRSPETSGEYARAHARLETVEGGARELARALREAGAVLRGRGAARRGGALLPARAEARSRPARDARRVFRSCSASSATRRPTERAKLAAALAAGKPARGESSPPSSCSAWTRSIPAIQIEVRQVRAETGAQVLRSLEDGKRAYAVGDRAGAQHRVRRACSSSTRERGRARLPLLPQALRRGRSPRS